MSSSEALFPGLSDQASTSVERQEALAFFEGLGLPTSADEPWLHTPLTVLKSGVWALASASSIADSSKLDEWRIAGLDALRLVFVDGILSEQDSDMAALPEGVSICREQIGAFQADASDAFSALNAAAATECVKIDVAEGVVVSQALQLLFVVGVSNADVAAFPSLRVEVGRNAELAIVEDHVSAGGAKSFTALQFDVVLNENASLSHERIVRTGDAELQLATMNVEQGRDSRFHSYAVSLGGKLLRHDVKVQLSGENAECGLSGLVIGDGEQIVDNHSEIVHAASHTRSSEHFRNVLDGKSRGVFAGRVIVSVGVVGADSSQRNANLLLSDTARMNALPQLEIYNDDVKASHGSTIGQLDQDSIFYMRSRGIEESTAKAMLTFGFANAVVESLPSEPLQALVREHMHTGLSSGSVLGELL